MGIVNNIAARRKRLKLNQRRLGELAGMDQPTVSRAENGHGTIETVKKLLDTLTTLEKTISVSHGEAAAFWAVALSAPASSGIVARLGVVAETLMSDPNDLNNAELGRQLCDCLPEAERTRITRRIDLEAKRRQAELDRREREDMRCALI